MKESYYFPHDYHARHDVKIEMLASDLKMEGLGIYWCLIEMLYEENGYLPVAYYERISNVLRTDYDKVKKVVEGYDLFKNDGVKFWSESVLRRINKIKEKSEKAKASILTRWGNTNVLRSKYDSNTVKERKEKKNKVNNMFVPPTLDDITKYVKDNNYTVDPNTFLKYFTESNWIDSNGKKVKNWKQKIITWNGRNSKPVVVQKNEFGY